jgi:lysophospholipase L1-like esterase
MNSTEPADAFQILCYGDSNTWGFNPANGARHPFASRWTSVLAHALGAGYHIIPEGMNGRTTVFEDPVEPGRNGLEYLLPCLVSHKPLDAVVIMLGTNDTKERFGLLAVDIALGMKRLVKLVQSSDCGPRGKAPRVGIIAPAHVNPAIVSGVFTGGPVRSALLAQEFANVAKELGCAFLDASLFVSCSMPDGIHLDASGHRTLGTEVARWILSDLLV